jgi:hypothetical protein
MRLRPFLLLASPLLLLAGCNPEPNPGPRIDLVGSTTPALLSADRSSTTPADTFTTRVFAEARDTLNGPALTRLRITVDYSPNRNPYVYPTNTAFNPDLVPKETTPFVYLDSVLAPGKRAAVFQYTAVTRSTSGQETWTFQVEDTEGASNKRSYRLTLRNADSLLTYHRYTLRLQAPRTRGSRSYLTLLSGLALPAFALGATTAQNRDSIDVVYVPLGVGARGLAAPADPTVPLAAWSPTSKRATEFRRTAPGFTFNNFTEADTAPELLAVFNAATAFAPSTRTGVLTKGQVVAFRTAGAKPKVGLLYVEDFPTAPQAAILVQVRITK